MTKSEIIRGIQDLFGDTSVPPSVTMDSLEEIGDLVEGYVEALREQLDNSED